MTRPEHVSSIKSLETKNQCIDVTSFFTTITREYQAFQQIIDDLSNELFIKTPEQILAECNKLGEKRKELAILDRQMFDIIDLASVEISQNTIIREHRIALAEVKRATHELYQKLQLLKATLQDNAV